MVNVICLLFAIHLFKYKENYVEQVYVLVNSKTKLRLVVS